MSKPFFLVGPTAVGKTRLALALAERAGAEIVSADAFQVYAGLDLLTAKPSPEELRRTPHHLVGSVPLSESYNAARFLADAQACLHGIATRGCPALVVGGTGLYVKALTHGLSPLPGADPALRAELEPLDYAALLARLRELDPAGAAVIDALNKRRLVRAVEVCLLTGRPFSSFQTLWHPTADTDKPYGVRLTCDREVLRTRIAQRTRRMFEQGVVEEVSAIPSDALSPTAAQMIGHAEIRACLAGQMNPSECETRIALATGRYAKRQGTWFRAQEGFTPLDLSAKPDHEAQSDALWEMYQQHRASSEDRAARPA